jgi:molybdopterin/thiamine biosynthesis adenylyltransferase
MSDIEISISDGLTDKNHSEENEVIIVTDPATDRYNSFGFISWWKQDVVHNARVMVVGAGALGNEVLKNLALMGVGQILVVDFDYIDDSNLSRSILFRAANNGRKKAEVAAEAVREINPDVAVQSFHGDINHDLGLGVFRRMDVVIGCLDNREARLSINEFCYHLNKPWIDGAIQELIGIARVFTPGQGACYECTLTDEDYRIINKRLSCNYLARKNIIEGKVPTTPTISSIISAIETQEALKILHGMPIESGKALFFNGLNNEFFTIEYPVKEDCLSHWIYDEIVELPECYSQTTTVKELLQIAQQALGPQAALMIPKFAVATVCQTCQHVNIFNRPLHSMNIDDGICQQCGERIEVEWTERVYGTESFLDFTLAQIGFPPIAVVTARTPDEQYQFFELTGDANTFFRFTKNDGEK